MLERTAYGFAHGGEGLSTASIAFSGKAAPFVSFLAFLRICMYVDFLVSEASVDAWRSSRVALSSSVPVQCAFYHLEVGRGISPFDNISSESSRYAANILVEPALLTT